MYKSTYLIGDKIFKRTMKNQQLNYMLVDSEESARNIHCYYVNVYRFNGEITHQVC
jgi:hypothetical protein